MQSVWLNRQICARPGLKFEDRFSCNVAHFVKVIISTFPVSWKAPISVKTCCRLLTVVAFKFSTVFTFIECVLSEVLGMSMLNCKYLGIFMFFE